MRCQQSHQPLSMRSLPNLSTLALLPLPAHQICFVRTTFAYLSMSQNNFLHHLPIAPVVAHIVTMIIFAAWNLSWATCFAKLKYRTDPVTLDVVMMLFVVVVGQTSTLTVSGKKPECHCLIHPLVMFPCTRGNLSTFVDVLSISCFVWLTRLALLCAVANNSKRVLMILTAAIAAKSSLPVDNYVGSAIFLLGCSLYMYFLFQRSVQEPFDPPALEAGMAQRRKAEAENSALLKGIPGRPM